MVVEGQTPMIQANPHAILPPAQFRMLYLLAARMGNHWASSLALGTCDREGIPVAPGACSGWSMAMIEAIARATPTGYPGSVMVPAIKTTVEDRYYLGGGTQDGRVSWQVNPSGMTAIWVHQPVTEGDPTRSIVLSVTLDERTHNLSVWDLPGHPQAHLTAEATVSDLALLADILTDVISHAHEALSSAIVQHRGEAHGNHLIVLLRELNQQVSHRINNDQRPYGQE